MDSTVLSEVRHGRLFLRTGPLAAPICCQIEIEFKESILPIDREHRRHPLRDSDFQFERLIRLVLLLAFMLFGVHWASQGRHWLWLMGPQPQLKQEPELKELNLKDKLRSTNAGDAKNGLSGIPEG